MTRWTARISQVVTIMWVAVRSRIRVMARSRFAPYLLAAAAVGLSILAMLPAPPPGQRPERTDYVVVIGAAGLRWGDIDAVRTPNLWRLAEHGTIGALSVRSANRTTCPADGWITLGAGNRARRTTGPVDGQCPSMVIPVERSAGSEGGSLSDQHAVVSTNRETVAWQVQPGALAEAVRCTTAIGPGAAVAAARPFGRIDRYLPNLDTAVASSLGQDLRACSLTMVDVGTVAGNGVARDANARLVDRAVGAVLSARPTRSLVMVAGLSDTGDAGRLHVAIAEGPGYRRGWLMSQATGRPGYVQLVDLAPTALEALDRPIPTDLFVGATAERVSNRPAQLTKAVHRLADADQQATVQRVVAARFLLVLSVGQLVLFWAVTPVLRRARRGGSPPYRGAGARSLRRCAPGQAKPLTRRALRVAEVVLVAAALAVPAALFADLVPWWRWRLPTLVFVAVTGGLLVVATTGIMLLARGRRAVMPMGAVAAVAAISVAADVMTGSRLQLNGVAGYSAATSGRYAGLGTIGLGVLIGGLLLLAGALAARVPRQWRPAVVAAASAVGIVVVGSPYLGSDAAGAVALSAGACLAAAAASGGWFTAPRMAAAVATGIVVTSGFAMLDLRRPAVARSNIGRFLVDLGDRTRGELEEQRLGAHNVTTMATSPLTLLVIGSAVFVWFVLIRPNGGLLRLFGLYPAIRATLGGICLATVFAGLMEGVGFNVLGAAASTVMPLVTLAVLRVVDHADDRTRPDDGPRSDAWAGSAADRHDTTVPATPPSGEVLA